MSSIHDIPYDTDEAGDDTIAGIIPWPAPISEIGMYGLAGDFVQLVQPHTEADPNILLLTFLVYAGNIIGRNFYMAAGGDKHCGNIYLCVVGHTGHGRKGSAFSVVDAFFRLGNCALGLPNVLHGISSGEGVIFEIRDQVHKQIKNRKTQKTEDTVVDTGVEDKRLIISLSEMQQCIVMTRRTDSILSSVLRQG
jgi:hypothetical protein